MNYFELYENGEMSYINKEYDLALEYFLKAYSMNSSNINANYMACCYIALKQYTEAEILLKDLTNMSFWEVPWYNLGRLYMLQNKDADALKCFLEAVLINPDNDDCYFYLGVYYEKNKDHSKAIFYYTKAVDLCKCEEDKSMYFNNIGLCHYRMNNVKEAIYYLNKALENDPHNEDAKYNMDLILNNYPEVSNEL